MSDAHSSELPLETTSGAAGAHATEAFAVLANETRLAILLALWELYDPHAAENVVAFSDIFDRVDYDDPGSFSYHLQQLTDHFVHQHPDGGGYELRLPARRFIHAVIAGAGIDDAGREPTEIDQACPFCDAPTTVAYREGVVVQRCTGCEGVGTAGTGEGFLSAVPFDPAGLDGRDAGELRAASRLAAWRQTQFMFEGLCPACSGRVDAWLTCCPDHDPAGQCETCGGTFASLARFECRTCKNHNVSSPQVLALFHPAVVAFYHERGVDTRVRADDVERVRRVFDLVDDHDLTVLSTDPPRAAVTVGMDDDEVRLVFDETVSIVEANH